MEFENLIYEKKENVVCITMNRPRNLNALNSITLQELHQALKQANLDAEVKVIILTGAGQKSFVAGADIKEFVKFNKIEGQQLSEKGHQLVFDFIENL